jgi:hypothetical protein
MAGGDSKDPTRPLGQVSDPVSVVADFDFSSAKFSSVEQQYLLRFPSAVLKAVERGAHKGAELFRFRLAGSPAQPKSESFSLAVGPNGLMRASEDDSLSKSSIASQRDLLDAITHLSRVRDILIPSSRTDNQKLLDAIFDWLAAGFEARSIATYVELVRRSRQTPTASWFDHDHVAWSVATAGSRPMSSANSGPRSRPSASATPNSSSGRVPAEIADACREAKLCIAFQKGSCKKDSGHFVGSRPPFAVQHRCSKCSSTAHGALACIASRQL